MNARSTETKPASLEGLTFLVVEDETIVSFLLEDMLADLGCTTVLHAGRIDDALKLLGERKFDCAVLDVNLGGEFAYPVAARLAEARIPFVFTTGYGRSGIPGDWASRPVIQKPFDIDALGAALQLAIAEASPSR